MAKPEIEYERYQEAKNPTSKEEIARDKAIRAEEKIMLEREAQRLKEENSPKFKAEVAKAVRGGGGGGLKPDTDVTASKKLPKMAKGGAVNSASKRADGCAVKGKTRGKIV